MDPSTPQNTSPFQPVDPQPVAPPQPPVAPPMAPPVQVSQPMAPQPGMPQQVAQPMYAPAGSAGTGVGEDPGKTLAIVGLVITILGMSLVGLILSIVASKKSKTAGFKNGIAKAGIIVGIIYTVLSVLVTIGFIALIAIGAMQSNGDDAQTKNELVLTGEAINTYANKLGYLPATLSDLSAVNGFDVANTTDVDGNAYEYSATPAGCEATSDCTGYKLSGKAAVAGDPDVVVMQELTSDPSVTPDATKQQ